MEKISNGVNLEFLAKEKSFDFLKKIKDEFPQSKVYLVGGAVRDLLLSQPTKDYDFVVSNVKAADLENFLTTQGVVNLVGQTFGVFKFIPPDSDPHNPIDIALPRKDFSLATGGYRDVEIQSDPNLKIEDDLGRRDFTINAIAIEIKNFTPASKFGVGAEKSKITEPKNQLFDYKLIDPYGGIDDLNKKLIRAVGKPGQRFKEDYSRMLRGIRLACQLNFEIEEHTWQAIKNKIKGLNEIKRSVELVASGQTAEQEIIEARVVPYETAAKEFLKSFKANPVQAFDLYNQSRAFNELIPEVLKMKGCPQPENFHAEGDVWEHACLTLEKLTSDEFKRQFGNEPVSIELILAALFHDIGKPDTIQTPEKHGTDRIRFNEHDLVGAKIAKEICQRLKLSSPGQVGIDQEKVVWLVEHHMLLVQGDIDKMRPGTIEKYFFSPHKPGQDLLKLSFADISATIPPSGKPDFAKFNQMLERIRSLKNLSQNKKELPKSLMNGHEIMKKFKLKPGRKIGQLLQLLREEQLQGRIKSKSGAIEFLKKELISHS